MLLTEEHGCLLQRSPWGGAWLQLHSVKGPGNCPLLYPLLLCLLPSFCNLDSVTLQVQGLQVERAALEGLPEL